jgi:hypothetical protein
VPFRIVLARSHMRWTLVFIVLGLACQNRERHRAGISARFEVSPDRSQIGFDTPFSVVVDVLGAPQRSFDVRWKQIGGVPLRDVAVTERGLRFSARTPRLADCREETLPWGVIPLSPRTRGEIVLEAEWQLGSDGTSRHESIVIAAAARSRGLPNVAVDQRIYLGGSGWRIDEAPSGAAASLEEHEGIASLRPHSRGIWHLSDGEGRALRIQAGRYVETPLDCGRAGCHAEIARAAQSSPMTWALARRLQHNARDRDATSDTRGARDLSCAMQCHVSGEPGTRDGGFFDVASDLGVPTSLEGVHELTELPRALRRLGSVGCLACHGPSALPEAHARWSILRSDVCAHCHDAPPRYGHVVAWRTTRMARADRDPRARSDRACTPCHTTWGFLRENDPHREENKIAERDPPSGVGAVGIACAACHAVHDGSTGTESRPSLLRVPHVSAMFAHVPAEARATNATCLACHAPRDSARLAQASAAALWAGRGGMDPETGAPLVGPAPHLTVDGGCVGCHREGPVDIEHGQSHGFRADRRRCTSCHDATRDLDWSNERARIEREARSLWGKLLAFWSPLRSMPESPDLPSQLPHAMAASSPDARTPVGRAAYDLSLVLEDRGFLTHNLPYARQLLETARKPIENASVAARRGNTE